MLMEYCDGGDLYKYIEVVKSTKIKGVPARIKQDVVCCPTPFTPVMT